MYIIMNGRNHELPKGSEIKCSGKSEHFLPHICHPSRLTQINCHSWWPINDLTGLVRRSLDSPSGHPPRPDASRPHPIIPQDLMDGEGNLKASDIGITWAGPDAFLHGARVVGPARRHHTNPPDLDRPRRHHTNRPRRHHTNRLRRHHTNRWGIIVEVTCLRHLLHAWRFPTRVNLCQP